MKIIVDRIEDCVATIELENGETANIPSFILGNFKEGDILTLTIEKNSEKDNTDTHSFFEKLRKKSKEDE